ncbi:putative Zn-dependent peptidase [Lewinella marina]|uniref:Peptidase M16 n=1 Tax=Neolewinella marina TaxID=438751 RepID=A0A2G0CGW3_9BACT|nr:pitrilysin family protein [Neolewinella marina]NJB86375.1 putative Zn-dependent peptidase [Neolewinella marina]PHK99157.1 peptidase M16 [Neolewinella marina]
MHTLTHRLVWPFLLLGLSLGLTAQAPAIDFVEYELDNGLKVLLHQDNTTPIVAVSIMYEVGGKDSFEGRTGFAHFFEHLLFEGSENLGRGEIDDYVQAAGGALNANTSLDRTYYYEILPSNQLALGLWIESERLLHARVLMEGVETQREVVKEERRQNYDNRPYGTISMELYKRAFKEHPYKDPNIGYMEDLNNAEMEDFQRFYKTYYVPNNAILSIAGDIDIEETKALIEKYFADIPRGPEPPRIDVVEAPLGGEVRDTVYDNVPLPALIMGYRTVARSHPDYYAISMMNQVLSQGQSSRLNKSLVDDKQLAVQVGSFPASSQDPGLAIAFAIARPGTTDLQAVEEAFNAEITRLQNEPITDRELQKLRNQVEVDAIAGYGSVAGIAESLADNEMFLGDANLINTETQRYLDVTKEDIRRVAREYYTNDNRVVLYWLPQPSSR